jgi:hypothetical protein
MSKEAGEAVKRKKGGGGYHRNHYVPIWYQRRFMVPGMKEQKFQYLDLKPANVVKGTRRMLRKDLMHWGPGRCFYQDDLYTTRFGGFESTDIEQYFFGGVDNAAPAALDYFATFNHPSADGDSFHALLPYMSLQKLRTPKGLAMMEARLQSPTKNQILLRLQQLGQMYCALWSECIWSIADASESATKFIVSDHPVTVYNKGCFPGSRTCANFGDPEIWQTGTHTIYPISIDRCLILTNLSWVRNCYANPLRDRPHPELFREAMFNFMQIQVGRKLSEREVIEINYVIKSRAYRYVAAAEREWLYPERKLGNTRWDRLGDGLLFMPDPRGVTFSIGIVMGFTGGGGTAFDAYGRRPWQADYDDGKGVDAVEWNGLHAFQGEFARRYGPKRRGSSYEAHRIVTEDSENFHRYHLQSEGKCKALMRATLRKRQTGH